MYIRNMHDDEYDEVIKLITQTVHTICKNDYSQNELCAWAPPNFNTNKFRSALKDCLNLAAFEKNIMVGFISVERSGYINRLYTHKDFQHRGIATALLLKAQEWAKENGIFVLSLDSSKTAEGFYLKNGFKKSGISLLQRGDVVFKNSVMKKIL